MTLAFDGVRDIVVKGFTSTTVSKEDHDSWKIRGEITLRRFVFRDRAALRSHPQTRV